MHHRFHSMPARGNSADSSCACCKGVRRGHVGSAFSVIDILRVLYDDVLRYDAKNPKWPGRDRCILSKGHGCLALYAMLADKGFFPEAELDRVLPARRHPRRPPGRDQSARRRGQSPAHSATACRIGLGMALHLRMAQVRLARVRRSSATASATKVRCGRPRCAPASTGSTISPRSSITTSTNPTAAPREVQDLEPFADKWRAFGFAVREVDGHDVAELRDVLTDCRSIRASPPRSSATRSRARAWRSPRTT